jgi:DNA-binding response OmpR family regulator
VRLLLVEDNPRLESLLSAFLSQRGFAVDGAPSLQSAHDYLATIAYDAIILDLGLPDGDGRDLLRDLRSRGKNTPVLILTARDAIEDRVSGLNLGADDYLLKPFHNDELEARLRAILRRPSDVLAQRIELGQLSFDMAERAVFFGDQRLELGRREVDVLEILLRRAGKIISRTALADAVHNADELVTENALEVCIHRLRKKLAPLNCGCEIHTIRGVGYILQELN